MANTSTLSLLGVGVMATRTVDWQRLAVPGVVASFLLWHAPQD